jgi:hypothetical protein
MRTSRTRLATILAFAATAFAASAGTASAAAAPCKPSPFHFTVTKYTGLRALTTGNKLIGAPSTPVYNSSRTAYKTITVTLTREASTSMTVSASVTVELKGLIAAVQMQTGLSASVSSSVSTAVAIPVRIPPQQFGWVQAVSGRATVTGTVTQTDAICNAVLYRGSITTQVPYNRPYLQAFTSARPPR